MKCSIFILHILICFVSIDSLPLFPSLPPLSAALRPLFPIGSNLFPGDPPAENEVTTTEEVTSTEAQIPGIHLPNLQLRPPGFPMPFPLLPFPFPLPLLLDLPSMRISDPSLPPLSKSAVRDGDDEEFTTTMEEIFTANL